MEGILFSSILTSSLEKGLVGSVPTAYPKLEKANLLKNERYSFQLFTFCQYINRDIPTFRVNVSGCDKDEISIREVKQVHADFPTYANDPSVGTKLYIENPTLQYPDILEPMDENIFRLTAGAMKALWFEFVPKTSGERTLTITVSCNGENIESHNLVLNVANVSAPEQTLIYTNWFHCDCLASYYRCGMFSEEHWKIIEDYMKTAVRGGINCILTPIFTPPLDTEVGSERPTAQLVAIKKTAKGYSFDFSALKRWIDMAHKCGVKYFEISHLFTQWGAKCAPKVVAEVDGEVKRIFGWETDGTGRDYAEFMTAFLPELTAFLSSEKILSNCYFHISDEPHEEHLEGYLKAKEIVKPYIGKQKMIDALSSVKFYENGAVDIPVPGINRIEPFLEAKIDERWAYYCCSQYVKTSNRFIAYPSFRNRIIGVTLYKFAITGFLQWGYNFYYSMGSRRLINPYENQSGDGLVPSGDTFVVYPGSDCKPVESLRFEVFYDAIQDYEALVLLEKKVGREKVLEVIKNIMGDITFNEYPMSAKPILKLRDTVCEMLNGD